VTLTSQPDSAYSEIVPSRWHIPGQFLLVVWILAHSRETKRGNRYSTRFFMNCTLPFERAVFFQFETLRMLALVLHERVIVPLARRAFQLDNLSGHLYRRYVVEVLRNLIACAGVPQGTPVAYRATQ
jgi:hypothetical protein